MSKVNQDKSFLPEKCLLYKDNFDGIIEGKLRPPIEVSFDPTTACNLNCVWCNGKKIRTNKIMPGWLMEETLRDIADWGVKGICFAGGGEPSIHPSLPDAVELCNNLGLETSIISNGFIWSDKLVEAVVKHMRWVGISVDASKKETFEMCKGVDGFERVIDTIQRLVTKRRELNTNVGITFKFLIHPANQEEIYDACLLAKKIGCDMIHLRPVDFLAYQKKEEFLDAKLINYQVNLAKKDLDDENFRILPFFVNFKDNLTRKIEFKKCRLSPLLGICTTEGWWVCVDRKGDEKLWLCNIEEIRDFWGSKKHLELLNKINPPKDCGKCTMAKYYPWFEAYEKDEFFWKFA